MPNSWNWKPIIESFLTAILSMVLTSTFVLTSFSREINVPGIPSIEYTNSMKTLHKLIKQMKNKNIWNRYDPEYSDFNNLVERIEKEMNDILALQGDYFSKISLNPVKKDILNLKKVLIRIKRKIPEEKVDEWKLFFEKSNKLNDKENSERLKPKNIELFESVERLRELKLEDLTCQRIILSILRFLHSI